MIVAVIGAGTLDSLPHNGAVVTLLDVVLRHAPVGEYARALAAYRDQLP